ncbi:unnamed protein product [Lactuca saligna]|uniref:Uncharacterized protein n=1 Tax=Lactuca saligna TaxID=75948 RepID=A0AA35YRC9_LACSI|nr:unnamed protein product [Lactuca saligna]
MHRSCVLDDMGSPRYMGLEKKELWYSWCGIKAVALERIQHKCSNSWGWWKVKKWMGHILNRLYTRFGDLKLKNLENKAFAQHFLKNYAGKFLECHLNLLNALRMGDYLPDRVSNLILQYLSNRFSMGTMNSVLLTSPYSSSFNLELEIENEAADV